MIKLKEKYFTDNFSLSSLDEETDVVWSRVGFTPHGTRESNRTTHPYHLKCN